MVGHTYPLHGRAQTCRPQILVRRLMRLRTSPVRRGNGFSYYGPDDELLTDEQTVQRIKPGRVRYRRS